MSDKPVCPTCHGTGVAPVDDEDLGGASVTNSFCPTCGGKPKRRRHVWETLHHSGWEGCIHCRAQRYMWDDQPEKLRQAHLPDGTPKPYCDRGGSRD